MYGLLLENIAAFIRLQWGEGKWDSVRRKAGIDAPSFSIHHVYAETLMSRLARCAVQVLGIEEREFFESMGVYFVDFVGQYGYDQVLSVLGRHLRDFLSGLDNLHEYLKFSYPKMRAPSFFCDKETENGLQLHYRSKRRGFIYYTMGQIKQVAKHFYDQECKIEVLTEELDGETMHVIFQLTFNNQAFIEAQNMLSMIRSEQQLPIRASLIFELFPFSVAFSPSMEIRYTGHALLTCAKDLVGQNMVEAFDLVRPLIPFCFQTIIERSNNIFELVTTTPIKEDEALQGMLDEEDEEKEGVGLRLRGQMLFMEDWNLILYLATPVMPDLDTMVNTGLYINDLSLHDCSRDLVLAGTQQSVELKLALDQEQHKSKKLEDSMKKLDEEMRKTDELLYQMIPKQVADRIRRGENPVDTCEVFENVSVLFSDVVTFTDICSRITPMQVVGMLNHMYSLFDQLTERNGVYKVETIGDAYMVVSGAPTVDGHHAERICDMALDMVDASQAIKDPSKGEDQDHLKLRVGCHSGMVVAGVVGVKMPRYCLFGDTVNTASRMESTGTGGKIQISETTKALIPSVYKVEERGKVPVKGKGDMQTYWLNERENRVALADLTCNSFVWTAPTVSVATIAGGAIASQKSIESLPSKQNSVSEDTLSAASNIVKDTKEKSGDKLTIRSPLAKQDSIRSERKDSQPGLLKDKSVEFVDLEVTKAGVGPTPNTLQAGTLTPERRASVTDIIRPTSAKLISLVGKKERANSGKASPDPNINKNLIILGSGNYPPPNQNSTNNSKVPPSVPAIKIVRQKTLINLDALTSDDKPQSRPPSSPRRRIPRAMSPGLVKAAVAISQIAKATESKVVSNAVADNSDATNANESSKPFEADQRPRPTVKNQTQENFLITKATLNDVNNGNANSFDATDDINNDAKASGRVPLLKRLRKNKVALLTSEAMAQLGCSGFRARQKEVVTPAAPAAPWPAPSFLWRNGDDTFMGIQSASFVPMLSSSEDELDDWMLI